MEYKQTKNNTKHTNIRISEEMYNKIEKLGEEAERNVSAQIRFMLNKYIEIIEKK